MAFTAYLRVVKRKFMVAYFSCSLEAAAPVSRKPFAKGLLSIFNFVICTQMSKT